MKKASHPLESIEIDLAISLRGETAKRCLEIAERRGQRPEEMLASVVNIVIDDDMVDAVIDDGAGQ